MNWTKDRSMLLSRGCVALFMLLLAALDLGCYWMVRWFVRQAWMNWQYGAMLMTTIYLCSVFGWGLLVRLWQLLSRCIYYSTVLGIDLGMFYKRRACALFILYTLIALFEETRGTETSKYPEEEKSTEIPLVAASERGRGQTD